MRMPENCLPTVEPVTQIAAPVAFARYGGAAWRKTLGLPVVLAGLLVCLTFCLCCWRFNDPDTWWHLKLGQEIWQTHSIPRSDHWSFTVYGHWWIPHEWLAQLWMYTVWRMFGYAGLQLWLCLTASAIVALSYTLSYRYCGDATVAALGGFLAFFFGTVSFTLRPQIIAYLLLTIELVVLLRAFRGKPRALWWLPLIFLIWVNCHASYPLGLGIFGAAVVCWYWRNHAEGLAGARWLIVPFALTCLMLLCNPVGWRMLLYPFDLLLRQRDNLTFINEWFPPDPESVRGLGFVLAVAAIGVAGLTRRARASVFELLVFVPVTFLAAQHTRMLIVFGIIAAPLICRMVAEHRGVRKAKPDHLPTNAVLVLLAAVLCVAMFPRAKKIQEDVEAANPVKAIEFIRNAHLRGPMLNDYGWGGYLVWALPEYKTFIDGRADVFDWTGVLAQYRDWVDLTVDPARLLDKYRIGFCLLPAAGTQVNVMRHLATWKQVYKDNVAVVFVRENQSAPQPGI